MDAAILTTFFCFILLIINLLLFTQLRELSNKLHHYVDRSDLHSENLQTILSILQQLEAKQDLMFANSPPVPGEQLIVLENSGTNCTPASLLKNAFPSEREGNHEWNMITPVTHSDWPQAISEPKKRGRKPGVKVGPYAKRPKVKQPRAQSQAEDSQDHS